jgi:hypothetical protein
LRALEIHFDVVVLNIADEPELISGFPNPKFKPRFLDSARTIPNPEYPVKVLVKLEQINAVIACGLRNARQHYIASKSSKSVPEGKVTADQLDWGINEALVAIRNVKHPPIAIRSS